MADSTGLIISAEILFIAINRLISVIRDCGAIEVLWGDRSITATGFSTQHFLVLLG